MSSTQVDRKTDMDKDSIEALKNLSTAEIAGYLDGVKTQANQLIAVFENFGYLPSTFDCDIFIPFISHPNERVRYWAVKNIGKKKSTEYLEILTERFYAEGSTIVKREIVSAIGRMRSVKTLTFLLEAIKNEDPKIAAQAIRALLCFKGDAETDNALMALSNHENETIRAVIQKEYFQNSEADTRRQPHADSYNYLTNLVVNADVRDALAVVEDDSIHLTFTSPPYYNARDYAIYPSYEAYLNFLAEVFEATYRVTKEGRYLIVNTSPVIVPRVSRAHSSKRYPIPFDLHTILVKMGWEFIDDIVWMKPEYSVKNRIGGFLQHRKPLAYKPNSITEYLMVYRKKTEKLIDWNIKQYTDEVVERSKVLGDFERTNVWQICPKSDKKHSAVFPDELCRRVIEYYSFKGDLVFDPFAGTGTLGKVAKKMDRHFFMVEKEEEYFDYMRYSGDLANERFMNLDRFRRVRYDTE